METEVTQTMRFHFSALVILTAVCIACSGEHPNDPGSTEETPDTTPAGFTISNPVLFNGNSTGIAAAQAASASAYVSAAPQTFPNTIKFVVIKNKSSAALLARIDVVQGGFDPVRIDGVPGDEVSVSLYTSDSEVLTVLHTKIPPRRPPRVVRTSPTSGRVDVALNTLIEVVFTEPVNRNTVNNVSPRLLKGSQIVEAEVELSTDGLTARITPVDLLDPITKYTLTVSEIRDLDGDTVAGPTTIDFTTAEPTGLIRVTIETVAVSGGVTDPDGYVLQIDNQSPVHVDPVSVWTFNAIGANHVLSLTGLSDNCFNDQFHRMVDIVIGATTDVELRVTCVPIPPVPQGMIAFVSERDGNAEIYTSNADGTNVRRLTDTSLRESDPKWSPDGKRIAFARWRTLDHLNQDFQLDEADIYTMDADGSNVVQLTNGGQNYAPSWSPDGTRLTYVHFGSARFRIRVLSVDNSTAAPVNLGFELGWNTDPAWSPDGRSILFASDWFYFDGPTQLVQVGVEVGDPRLLPLPYHEDHNFYYYYLQPAWSPNGERIAIAECYWFNICGDAGFIAVASLDGAEHKRIVETSRIQSPTWSPDGAFIAYSAQACIECSGLSIFYISPDGTKKGTILSDAYSPSWRPSPR